jgi:hypothetical protein
VEQQGLNFKLRHYRAEPGLVSTSKRTPMAHAALWSSKRFLIAVTIVLSVLRGTAAFGQTTPVESDELVAGKDKLNASTSIPATDPGFIPTN